MKFGIAFFGFILALSASGKPPLEEPKIVEKVTPLPVAFDKDFEFRKTKLFFLSEKGQPTSGSARQTTSTLQDRKSTRLNSSHSQISYAVFCLKKKIRTNDITLVSGSPFSMVCRTKMNSSLAYTSLTENFLMTLNRGPTVIASARPQI